MKRGFPQSFIIFFYLSKQLMTSTVSLYNSHVKSKQQIIFLIYHYIWMEDEYTIELSNRQYKQPNFKLT